jgi:hypothetical protein
MLAQDLANRKSARARVFAQISRPIKSYGRSITLAVALIGSTMLSLTSAPAFALSEGFVAASDPSDRRDMDRGNDRDEDKDRDKDRDEGKIHFIVPLPGIQTSIWDDGTVSLAIPLQNDSDRSAANVTVTSISVPSATYLGPNSLPIRLGEMIPQTVQVMDARFSMTQPKFSIIVKGTYNIGSKSFRFDVHDFVRPLQPNNAPIVATNGTSQKLTASTATYPPPPPPPPANPPPNNPEFDVVGIRQPLGQFRNLFSTPPPASILNRVSAFGPGDQLPPPGGNASSVVFTRNTKGTSGGLPPDPSVAGADATGFAMFSVNTNVSYSKDAGQTFTVVGLTGINDPAIPTRTDFFPQDDGGLCCDQVVTYIPKRNIYVWLLQYQAKPIVLNGKNTTGGNRLRIAWATPQAAAADFLHAWTWVDLTSDVTPNCTGLGLGNDWMDYPDLAFSDNFLYVGVDHGIQGTGSVHPDRHIFVRLSLNDMLNPSSSVVNYQYMDPTHNGLWQNHIVQSSPDEMIWSALPDTSTLTVYSWPDSSDSASPRDIKISSYLNNDYSAPAPDTFNWNVAPANALGATRTEPFVLGSTAPLYLYFAWSAGRDNTHGRPYPYVRVEKADLDSFTLVSELDIWNPGFAFATPALVSRLGSGRDEVAISLAIGGGGNYADNAVGFLGDFVVYVTTDSDITQAVYNRDKSGNIIKDSAGNPTYTVRYGDYFDVRNSTGPLTFTGRGVGYSTLGYAVKAATAGKNGPDGGWNIVPHYVQFGREADLFPSPTPPPPK